MSPLLRVLRRAAAANAGSGVVLDGVTYKRWSDPATWGGGVIPGVGAGVGANVTLPVGENILYDVNVTLGTLTVSGSSAFDETRDIDVRVDSMFVNPTGAVRAGTESRRYTRRSGITLKGPMKAGLTRGLTHTVNTPTGNNATTNDDGGIYRALMVDGGVLSLNGKFRTRKARIAAHIAAGATQMLLREAPVGWEVGDVLGIGITTYFGNSTLEYVKIVTIAGASVGFARCTMHGAAVTGGNGLLKARWGLKQYPKNVAYGTDAVASTLDTSIVYAGNTPQSVDEAATVVNLESNLYVRGVDDAVWASNEFGGHTMAMNRLCTYVMRDVAMTYMGQGGLLGRYPWHVHGQAVNGGTTILGVSANCLASGVTVRGSPNRAFVHHATYGSRQLNCVGAAIAGWATFLETGAERYYDISGNVMMDVYDPAERSPLGVQARLKQFDKRVSYESGPGGYWLANMGGEFSDNTAVECVIGIWNTPHPFYLGIAKNLAGPVPLNMAMPVHRRNLSHSHRGVAMITGNNVADEEGNFGRADAYAPTTDEGPAVMVLDPRHLTMTLEGFTAFKCPVGVYSNNVRKALYLGLAVADWNGHGLQGSVGDDSFIREFLFLGNTLNVDTVNDPLPAWALPERVGIAAYHGGAIAQTGIACNLRHGVPFRNDQTYSNNSHGLYITSCLMGMWDEYLNPWEDQFVKATNIQMFNGLFAYRVPPKSLYGKAPYIGLTGAPGEGETGRMLSMGVRLPTGYLGSAAGQAWVYDIPFLTYGKTKTKAFPPDIENGCFVDGSFYGCHPYIRDGIEGDRIPWTVQRQSSTGTVIDTHVMAEHPEPFRNMKHFIAAKDTAGEPDSWFFVTYPDPAFGNDAPVTTVTAMRLTHQLALSDVFYLGIRFAGATPAMVFTDSFESRFGQQAISVRKALNAAITQGSQVRFAAAATQTRAGLRAAPINSYWHDTANSILWAKVGGGLANAFGNAWPAPGSIAGPTSYERAQIIYFRDAVANG